MYNTAYCTVGHHSIQYFMCSKAKALDNDKHFKWYLSMTPPQSTIHEFFELPGIAVMMTTVHSVQVSLFKLQYTSCLQGFWSLIHVDHLLTQVFVLYFDHCCYSTQMWTLPSTRNLPHCGFPANYTVHVTSFQGSLPETLYCVHKISVIWPPLRPQLPLPSTVLYFQQCAILYSLHMVYLQYGHVARYSFPSWDIVYIRFCMLIPMTSNELRPPPPTIQYMMLLDVLVFIALHPHGKFP